MKIFIDAGHGGADSGAIGNGLYEKNITLDIALREKALFEALGHEVNMSRTTDVTVDLMARTDMANTWGADVMISDHVNAGGGIGEEVWCSIYGGQGATFAQRVEALLDDFFVDRGVKTRQGENGDYLSIIRESKMPAILVEFGFIDNATDASHLSDGDFRQRCAEAVVKGILNIPSIPNPNPIPAPQPAPQPNPVNPFVLGLQQKLNRLRFVGGNGKRLTEDGIAGNNTTYAITKFQSVVGIQADGIPGPQTCSVIDVILNKPVLKAGGVNALVAVRYLQWRLGLSVDGAFGPNTKAAVIRFQKNNGLGADGVVGPMSWKALIG